MTYSLHALSIDEICTALSNTDPNHQIPWTPDNGFSWRGSYSELGMSLTDEPGTVTDLITFLQGMIHERVYGWKGGEYSITSSSTVHFSDGSHDTGSPFNETVMRDLFEIDLPLDRPWEEFVSWMATDPEFRETKIWIGEHKRWGTRTQLEAWADGGVCSPDERVDLRFHLNRAPSTWEIRLLDLTLKRGGSDPDLRNLAIGLLGQNNSYEISLALKPEPEETYEQTT